VSDVPKKDHKEDEFPGDDALREVHAARSVLLQMAKRKGMTLAEFVRSLKLSNAKQP
jgi:hypothetical protein